MSDHCEGCVGCEVDGVPISEATWLDWPWLKRKVQPLTGSTTWPRHGATDAKDPGPDVRVDTIGRRRRIRRGHPPTSGPATETLSGTYVGSGFVRMGVTDRRSTHGGVKGAKGTPR